MWHAKVYKQKQLDYKKVTWGTVTKNHQHIMSRNYNILRSTYIHSSKSDIIKNV